MLHFEFILKQFGILPYHLYWGLWELFFWQEYFCFYFLRCFSFKSRFIRKQVGVKKNQSVFFIPYQIINFLKRYPTFLINLCEVLQTLTKTKDKNRKEELIFTFVKWSIFKVDLCWSFSILTICKTWNRFSILIFTLV